MDRVGSGDAHPVSEVQIESFRVTTQLIIREER